MARFFTASGRFAVRFRWAIVWAWIAAPVLAGLFFPSLTSVANANNARCWCRRQLRSSAAGTGGLPRTPRGLALLPAPGGASQTRRRPLGYRDSQP
ncbi:MAG TPA: hypothetical protein VF940_23695 [Streptosporangiaceae bacterium]